MVLVTSRRRTLQSGLAGSGGGHSLLVAEVRLVQLVVEAVALE